jgi:hypothetical protein
MNHNAIADTAAPRRDTDGAAEINESPCRRGEARGAPDAIAGTAVGPAPRRGRGGAAAINESPCRRGEARFAPNAIAGTAQREAVRVEGRSRGRGASAATR